MNMDLETDMNPIDAQVQEEILDILGRSEFPLDNHKIHRLTQFSPGAASTAEQLNRLVRDGRIKRSIDPYISMAVYKLVNGSKRDDPTAQTQSNPNPRIESKSEADQKPAMPAPRRGGLRALILDHLASSAQPLSSAQIAHGIGRPELGHKVSKAAYALQSIGKISSEPSAAGNRRLWSLSPSCAPQAPARIATTEPTLQTVAPAVSTSTPAVKSTLDWSLTARGTLVLRSESTELRLSQRESLALRRFLALVDLPEIQEARP